MDTHLDKDVYTNKIEYFFSLHGPRFEYMNKSMASSLSKRFGKEFRPISIFNAWPSKNYSNGNYIILNKKGYKLAEELNKSVVYLPDYEDVNVEFAQSMFIKEVAMKLLEKQQTVYVYPFTTSFLDLPQDVFTVLGPDSKLAKKYDNKVCQTELFEALDLPRNKTKIYEDEVSLLEKESEIIPCYLSAAYTSGGNESGLIYDSDMLREFLANTKSSKISATKK
jgi:hypothetical protein